MNRDDYPYYLIHIKTSGEVLRVKTDKQEPPLELLQRLVGGYIEAVPAKHGVLIVNDAGKLYPLAMNAVATEMLRSDIHDVICGDAVLVQAATNKRHRRKCGPKSLETVIDCYDTQLSVDDLGQGVIPTF